MADIDSESLQAVKSLRSKFEQLASEQHSPTPPTSGQRTTNASAQTAMLAVTAPSSPRRRAASGSHDIPDSVVHLRTSSSSSDLRVPGKRAPPPPPPPRGSKLLSQNPSPSPTESPVPSPLLRPVPLPPVKQEIKELVVPPNVAALKSKFAATPSPPSRNQSPRPSVSPAPIIQIPPTIPPRPSSINIHSTSPEQASSSSSSSSSPSESGAESRIPPPVPVRRPNLGDTASLRSIESLTDSDISLPPPQHASRSGALPPPPRPPSRQPQQTINSITTSKPSASLQPPPPLPVRRATVQDSPITPSSPGPPPPLPSRTNGDLPAPIAERRPVGSSRLPPPPTRTIALGDKLPPARRPSTPSSEDESGEDDPPKAQAADLMPDSSTSSRRPPILGFREGYAEPKIHVHPHSGCIVVSGTHVVVGHGHHLKIYDLAMSEILIYNMDTREMGLKDVKITAMEFRPTLLKSDRGYLLWVGTKEGHLFEVDIRTGSVRCSKYTAHPHPISGLFRHARSMISLDESGKALVWSPDAENQEDVSLQTTVPRVVRTTEKQDFVKMVGGLLWFAARADQQAVLPNGLGGGSGSGSGSSGIGGGGTASPAPGQAQKVPVIRVFDVFDPANTGRSIMPTEHVGPVTSATIIPSQPRTVYVGHEEGFISLWTLDTPDGYPSCFEIMRVSMSDVLSIEGVNDRLWAGSRNGMISAYDTTHRPWTLTNCWAAHPGLPVLKLMVNHFAIQRNGRLCVASVGRDESVRLWDGLLGLDWVDKELFKQETSFSTFRDLTVLVVSWNCDSAKPDTLNSDPDPANFNFLHDALTSVDTPPDVIVFGFQEVIDLESRKMTAKNLAYGRKSSHHPSPGGGHGHGGGGAGSSSPRSTKSGKAKKPEDTLSERVSGAYKRWYDRLCLAVKAAMPGDEGYCVVHTENLVGLFSCIFVKAGDRTHFDDVAITCVKRGMGGRYGNKGGIIARFVIGDSSICFVNCHLAAGQNAVRQRNADVAGILEDKAVFAPTQHASAYVGGGDGSMVLDHEFVFFSGDMNYRIDHRRDAILSAIRSGDLTSLHSHDQLTREIKFNRGCRLRGFSEGPLSFAPTYKYDRGTDAYDSSEKHRSPAWCDRILWRARTLERVRMLGYKRYEANVSDHRPISGAYEVRVKEFDMPRREGARKELMGRWVKEQERLLAMSAQFYVGQALL